MADDIKTTREAIAQAQKEHLKLLQQINKLTAIPRASDGRTENLGNAPTLPPAEPTVNEPGNVIYHNPPPTEPAPA